MTGDLRMSTSTPRLGLAAIVVFGVIALPAISKAADQTIPGRVGGASHPYYCGPAGCLRVTYEYHRELRSTYGTRFDPRNFDQTEPYYYFGRLRPYPRYWVEPNY
jgi:hypothetical protein